MVDIDNVFKAYDIRGLFPDQIDAGLANSIGSAFAGWLARQGNDRPVIVARDMRPSGVELTAAFIEGVRSQGSSVIDIGLASTDMLYFASGHLDAPGAIFTASHNPAGYNGIKLCGRAASPIGIDSGLGAIKSIVASGETPESERAAPGGLETADLLDAFADHVRSFVDTSRLAPLRIVADTANGMGGLVVPAVFAPLPVEVDLMYGELDGTFPNHPADPIQEENQRDLRDRVLEIEADLGLAFDGDADRVFLVDEHAEPLSGSLTTAIVAAGLLEREPGATVIHNLICSKAVPEVITERGGTPVRSRVGHSYIKELMAETGAAFGGEHSGHYYFRDNYRADSGLIASLVLLQQLSDSGHTLSELRKPFERYAASGEINTRVTDPQRVIDVVAATYPDAAQDRLDGLTADFGTWWFNLRGSNTEPLLRLNLEAADETSCAERVAEVRGHIEPFREDAP